MSVRIRSPRDLGAGAVFLLFGLCAVIVGRNYPMGTAARMGAGYFPIVLGFLLVALGSVICIRSFVVTGEKIESISIRALVLVLGSIAAFAATVDTLGLVAATVLVTVIGAAASPESRWKEVIVIAIAMLALSVGVFAYGLGLPFKLLPY